MNDFNTISDDALATVNGGKSGSPQDMSNMDGKNSGSSSSNDQLLSMLQGIQSSINDLSKNKNNGLFGGNNALLFMTMALAFSRRSEVVVYGGRRGYGYSWRAW